MPVTPDHSAKRTTEPDELSRYEISAAMNAVIRTCADIVRAHSHRGFWTPAGHPDGDPPTASLIASARQDVLSKLTLVTTCAETVIHEIDHGPTKAKAPKSPTE